MSESIKQAVAELTETKAANVMLQGRLDGYKEACKNLGDLFNQAKKENETLRTMLDGQLLASYLSATDDKEAAERGMDREPLLGSSSRDLSDFLGRDFDLIDAGEKSDFTFADAAPAEEEKEQPPPLLRGGSSQGERELNSQPLYPMMALRLSQLPALPRATGPRPELNENSLSIRIHELSASVGEVTGQSGVVVSIATKLSDLTTDIMQYEDRHQHDKKMLNDLTQKCSYQKQMILDMEMEMAKLRFENTRFFHKVKHDADTEPTDTRTGQIPQSLDSRKIQIYEEKLRKYDENRENQFRHMDKILLDNKKEKQEMQIKIEDISRELDIQVQTNDTLQRGVQALEDDKWNWQEDLRLLEAENERLRCNRRDMVNNLSPSVQAADNTSLRTELELFRCQANTYKEDFENERRDREKFARNNDQIQLKLQNALYAFEKQKSAMDKKETILKRKVQTLEKDNEDQRQIVDDLERGLQRAQSTSLGRLSRPTPPEQPSLPTPQEPCWSTCQEQPCRSTPEEPPCRSTRQEQPFWRGLQERPSLPTPAQGYESPGEVGERSWSCSSCTYVNPARRSNCEMCGTSKVPTFPNVPHHRLVPRIHGQLGDDLTCDVKEND